MAEISKELMAGAQNIVSLIIKGKEEKIKAAHITFCDISQYDAQHTQYAPEIHITFKKEHWWQ